MSRPKQVPVHPDLRGFLARNKGIELQANQTMDASTLECYAVEHGRQLAAQAIDGQIHGMAWPGPPFNLEMLASLLGHEVKSQRPLLSADAELHPNPKALGTYIIYLNPNQHKYRRNFSLAHELSHTIFPPFDGSVRARATTPDPALNFLEKLCDLVASELLLPHGPFVTLMQQLGGLQTTALQELSNTFEASQEAVGNRMVKLCGIPAAMVIFSHRTKPSEDYNEDQLFLFPPPAIERKLRVDYCIPGPGVSLHLPKHQSLPANSPLWNVYRTGIAYSGPVEMKVKSGLMQVHSEACRLSSGQHSERVLALITGLPGSLVP